MKNLLLLIFMTMLCGVSAYAQQVPQGMRYQAVARDVDGQVINEQPISLQIHLRAGERGEVLYTEQHRVTTNSLGLFAVTVGGGKTIFGEFASIPWSLADIWMDIEMDDQGGRRFVTINSSQLLAVPYAFHAGTAGSVTGEENELGKNGPQFYWSINGNTGTFPSNHYMGTRDYKDLRFGTNGQNRMMITKDGEIDIAGGLDVGAGLFVAEDANIGNDLRVERNASIGQDLLVERNTQMDGILEVDGTLGVDGITTLRNPAESTTKDNGSLVVEGGVGIEKNVNIGGNTEVDGTLGVDGVTTLRNTAESTTKDNGSLVVEGGVGIEKNVNIGGNTEVDGTLGVDGVTNLRNNLLVTKNDANFVATFQNTNAGSGDGLLIRLGKARTPFTPPTQTEVIDAATQTAMMNLIRSDVSQSAKINILGNLIADGAAEDLNTVVGLAIGTGNLIVNFINSGIGLPFNISQPINNGIGLPFNLTAPINSGLNLPLQIGPYSTPSIFIWNETEIFGGLDLGALGGIPRLAIPGLTIPAVQVLPQVTVMPTLPNVTIPAIPNLAIPAIPTIPSNAFGFQAIDPTSLAFWGIPNLVLTDAAGNFLNNENEFVRFEDSNNVKVGSIRAVSISDFAQDYLNPAFLYTLYGAITSSKIDKLHARYHFTSEIATVVKDYIKLGVEYSSGAGDYAEWLERIDNKERISAGDIVAVIGGKITKDLENAEQVMAVSHNPIVLGNVPADGKTHLGNNVAFMGQIPVKVLGPVNSGDYIVAQFSTPGFGKAISQEDMTIEDFKYAVGRAWGTNTSEGPKMINTVVGVHNGDYLKIIKRMESKLIEAENNYKASEARLNSLESKVDALITSSSIVVGGK